MEDRLSLIRPWDGACNGAVESARSQKGAESLLHDLNQRVESCLTIVSTLMGQQARDTVDPTARRAISTAQGRLQALARCHKALLRQPRPDRLHVSAVIRDVAASLAISWEALDRGIDVSIGTDPAWMPPDTAIPLVLITNELVSNALRYAFRGRISGLIKVELRVQGPSLVLAVRDDGIGISDKTLRSGGAGLKLIHEMAHQIGATVLFHREAGTTALVSVPLRNAVG